MTHQERPRHTRGALQRCQTLARHGPYHIDILRNNDLLSEARARSGVSELSHCHFGYSCQLSYRRYSHSASRPRQWDALESASAGEAEGHALLSRTKHEDETHQARDGVQPSTAGLA